MSYDLAVFDPVAAPLEKRAFLGWYDLITEWSEDRDYSDIQGLAPVLTAWFQDMIKEFPPMNGPHASAASDASRISDYSIDESLIYVAFAWSVAEPAYEAMYRLAAKHGVGFFDVSSNDGKVWMPEAPGRLKVTFNAS